MIETACPEVQHRVVSRTATWRRGLLDAASKLDDSSPFLLHGEICNKDVASLNDGRFSEQYSNREPKLRINQQE